jgi:hypothetical protein
MGNSFTNRTNVASFLSGPGEDAGTSSGYRSSDCLSEIVSWPSVPAVVR